MRLFRFFAALAAVPLACAGPEADRGDINVTVEFVGTNADGKLKLDPPDNFPFQVKVTAQTPQLRSPLQAQLTLIPGTLAVAKGGVTTASVTLLPDGKDSYSGIATLNAPGPGSVSVNVDVAGNAPATTPHAEIERVAITGKIRPSGSWSGSAPGYQGCVETSAAAGTIALTSVDSTVLMAMTTSLTLVTGPCGDDWFTGGPGLSHAVFAVTHAPPFNIVATLGGAPLGADSSSWTTSLNVTDPITLDLAFPATAPMPSPVPAGLLYQFPLTATAGTTKIAGLSVQFSLLPSTTGSVTPSSATTAVDGTAVVNVILPSATSQVLLIAQAGNKLATLAVPEQNASTPVLTLGKVTFAAAGPASADATPYMIDAMGLADKKIAVGKPVAFQVIFPAGADAPAVAPAQQLTDGTGHAHAVVAVPTGTTSVRVAVSLAQSLAICDIPGDPASTCTVITP